MAGIKETETPRELLKRYKHKDNTPEEKSAIREEAIDRVLVEAHEGNKKHDMSSTRIEDFGLALKAMNERILEVEKKLKGDGKEA